MTTETIAVLFTDWVGSTQQLVSLGEERTELLRKELYRIQREAVSESGAREVKNLGDGLMFVFPSASSCVAGAVAIQQGIECFNRSAPVPLALRVGASLGDVDASDGDYFGVPVVEAARLCAAADGEQILVSASLHQLARGRADSEFTPAGDLDLKGFDAPVTAYAVTWEPLSRLRAPLQARIEPHGSIGFVGRAAELEVLVEALKHVDSSGRRHVALISGEAGIGKTSIITEFASVAHEAGALVAYGRCDDELGVPYQPWIEAISHLVGHAEPAALEEHVAARGGDLMPLVPALAERIGAVPPPRSADPETGRHLLFAAVVDVLDRLAAGGPVVLFLDDLHWADSTTVQLLRHVAGAAEELPVLIVATFRDTDVGASHPMADLLAAFHREPRVDRIQMAGFDDLELASLMEAAAGHALEDDALALRDALARETDGNPFFATEMLRHLAETGAIAQDDGGRWRANGELPTVGLPVSVREVVGRRVTRLGEDVQRALTAAAVIGRDFELAVLESVTDIDEDELLDVLERAVDAAVVAEVPGPAGRYTFVHALIQRTLYDELGATRRSRLHRRVAESLEGFEHARDDHVAELARHWYEATRPDDVEKAFEYARRAGDQAQARLAPAEAVRWYTRALDLVDRAGNPSLRADCLVRLGTAERLAGVAGYRETLLEAARLAEAAGDGTQLTSAALANFRGFFSIAGTADVERIAVLDAALASDAASDPALRARLLARLAQETFFAPDRAPIEAIDDALRLAAASGDSTARFDALVALMLCFRPATLGRRLEHLAELLELSDQSGDPARRFWALQVALIAWVESADIEAARHASETLATLAAEIADPATTWLVLVSKQMFAAATGDHGGAAELAALTLERGLEQGQPDALLIGGSQIAWNHFLRREFDDTIAVLGAALPSHDLLPLHLAHVASLFRAGRRSEAVAALPALDGVALTALTEDQLGGATLAMFALCAPLLPPSVLESMRGVLAEMEGKLLTSAASILLSTDDALGLVLDAQGDHAGADAALARSLELLEASELAMLALATRLQWAQLLAARGDPGSLDASRALARTAEAEARRLDIPLVGAECARLAEESAPG